MRSSEGLLACLTVDNSKQQFDLSVDVPNISFWIISVSPTSSFLYKCHNSQKCRKVKRCDKADAKLESIASIPEFSVFFMLWSTCICARYQHITLSSLFLIWRLPTLFLCQLVDLYTCETETYQRDIVHVWMWHDRYTGKQTPVDWHKHKYSIVPPVIKLPIRQMITTQ